MYVFDSHFTALHNNDRNARLVNAIGGNIFNLAHDKHPVFDHLAKYNMLAVEKVALGACNEKLTTIRILARVGWKLGCD